MGQVVPFIARVRDSGDWTAAERARLEGLADQLGRAGVDVEVIFGATDEGDPWCVVADKNGDVLIHVARIAGTFVVHSAVDEAMTEAPDLPSALREALSVTEEAVAPKSATILPFELRQAQQLLALVVATAFFYETAGLGDEAHAAEPPRVPVTHDEPAPALPAAHDDGHAQDREAIARGAALQADDAAPTANVAPTEPAAAPALHEEAPAAPLPQVESATREAAGRPAPAVLAAAAADNPAPAEIRGTEHDDSLAGTAANEHILGGAGNDTIDGGGGHDTLDGGDGDDRIELAAGVVAIGGHGADTFVIRFPGPHGPGGPAPPEGFYFGAILDFSAGQGDHIVNGQGMGVRLTPHPTDGTPDGQGGPIHTFTTTTLDGHPVTRVDVDLDGDGHNDGYILVGHPGAGPPPPGEHDDPPIGVTGHALGASNPFGG